MIHEEICTYEVCKLAKEKGFNIPTAEFYNDDGNIGCYPRAFNHNEFPDGDYAAPTQGLLQRWLREEKGIIVIPYYRSIIRMWSATYELTSPYMFKDLRKRFKTYELALEDALKYVLENLL